MSQRVKGQEVEIMLIVNSVAQVTLTDIRSSEFAFMLEILSEGYLGETTERKDSIFKGIRGDLELHFENSDIFKFFKAVVDKARRRTPGTLINIKQTLNFPNGQRARVLIPNCEFGEIPVGFGSRGDYGTVKLTFEAAEANSIT